MNLTAETATSRLAAPERRSRQRAVLQSLYPLGCCLVVLACVLLANPFADAGFIDDWSYSHVALKLAQTGGLHYNGWGSPTVLFQAVWGALWIRLFGFSFDLLRVTTLPFSLGFVLLVYALGRKTGLRRDLACFGALTVGVSPLFVPLTATFMTDVYGCFFTTLCVYAAIGGLQAANTSSATLWLWILAVSGIVGGSNRQTVWAAPLALIPYLFWIRRSDRRFFLHAVAAFMLCLASLSFVMYRFTQPYAPLALSKQQLIRAAIRNALTASGDLISLALTSLLFTLPVLLCFTPFWRRLGPSRILLSLFFSAGLILSLVYIFGQVGCVPFARGLLSEFGIWWQGQDALGFRPVLLSPALRIGLSVLVVFGTLAFCLLFETTHSSLGRAPKAAFVLISGAYIALLIPGAIAGYSYDRYALPLIPVLIVFVLHRFQSCGQRISRSAWLCLLAFAAYGIAITHDYSSGLRARVQAARSVELLGISRSHISAGFEYDGWSQLQLVGRIKGVGYRDSFEWNSVGKYWFWNYATALQPEYVATYARESERSHGEIPTVLFSTWMPPFRRALIVRKRADLPKGKICYSLQPCGIVPQ
jgi:hypothetical protein